MNSYCRCCGEYTTERGPFGVWLCTPCWEWEDERIANSPSNI